MSRELIREESEKMKKRLQQAGIPVSHIEIAGSFWKKAKGLMFRESLPEGHTLLMGFSKECRPGIWMLFMRFPINIAFLDNDMNVLEIRENLKPVSLNPKTWRIYYPEKRCRYVVEYLPACCGNHAKSAE